MRGYLKKRLYAIIALLLTVMLLPLSGFGTRNAKASDEITLVVHYHRYDEAYTGWNLWVWPYGGDGAAYQFDSSDDFGLTAEIKLSSELTQAGIIVRLNDWAAKDWEADRYIDLTKAVDGRVDAYLIQGTEKICYSVEDTDLSPKFLGASLVSTTEINFTVTVPINPAPSSEADNYTVKDENGTEYPISRIKSDTMSLTTTATVVMQEGLGFAHTYTLSREGYGEIMVTNTAFSTEEFESSFTYEGELGAIYSKEKTTFRVWAPTASDVKLNLYDTGDGDTLRETVEMTLDVQGTWVYEKAGDLNGVYYTYSVTVADTEQEAVDPYARAAGVNGQRGMVIDLDSTDPEGWENDVSPELDSSTDAIIYELHVRDFSSDASSGITNTGKYLAFTETGTTNASGASTGIDYLKKLGITHVHLLPVFDFASVDESAENASFNWGYDPENYNVPEGSYSTDPYNGEVRINEFKQMVASLHESGISVVMDVVYNHTSATLDSNFNKIVPDYYYRKTESGFSNASGCGNETASERAMVRKFIIESVVYWATEYHIDGFRFDLMGIHDIETMNMIREALDEIDPSIIIYGEGWTGGSSTLDESLRAVKANAGELDDRIAVFSDDIRDGLKGNVFNDSAIGFLTGSLTNKADIMFGIVASTEHPQVNYDALTKGGGEAWADEPTQTINYASAHDNLTLWDKIATSNGTETVENRKNMNKLSAAIILTSQGIPFFQAGEEMLRSKPKAGGGFDENSYKSSDATNSIKWNNLSSVPEIVDYYEGLIAFRKAHSALRMTTTEDIASHLKFIEGTAENVIAYTIDGKPNGETAESIYVAFNAGQESCTLTLPEGVWYEYVNGEKAGTEILSTIYNGQVEVEALSAAVLVLSDTEKQSDYQTDDNTNGEEKKTAVGIGLIITIVIAGCAVIAGLVVLAVTKHKKKHN